MRTYHHALVYLAFFLLHSLFALKMKFPTVFYDEANYLGFGRFFAGVAPLPNLHGGAFASFGYGLVIAPAFVHAGSFLESYRLVLLINSLIISSSYFLLYFIARTVLRTTDLTAVAISAVACLYPSFLLFSNYAISENLFVPLFLLFLVCATRFISKANPLNAVAFGLCTGSLYTVHSRSLGVVVVALVLIIYLVASRRSSLQTAVLAGVIAALVIAVTRVGYGMLMNAGWGGSAEVTIAGTLTPLASLGGLSRALVALIGEVFYLLVNTFGLWALGIAYGTIMLWTAVKRRASGALLDEHALCIAFFLLCVLSVLVVSSVFIASYDPTLTRPDFLVTGRYNEGVIAIPILLGLWFLIDSRKRENLDGVSTICLLVVVFAYIGSSLFVIPKFHYLEWLQFPAGRINVFAMMGWLRALHAANFTLMAGISMSVFLAIFYLRRNNYTIVAAAILFVTLAQIELTADVLAEQRAIWPAFARNVGEYPLKLGGFLAGLSKGTPISYDMAVWNPFLYPSYQLWFPQARFVQFDSRLREAPQSEVTIAGQDWKLTGKPEYLIGCETLADNCLFVSSAGVAKQLRYVPLSTDIGPEAVVGVVTRGVYPEEGDATFRYRWTNGKALFTYPIPDGPPPTRMDIELIVPARFQLMIGVDNATLFEGLAGPGTWKRVFCLPRVKPGTDLRITLRSDTFKPNTVNGDTRILGVQLVSLKIR